MLAAMMLFAGTALASTLGPNRAYVQSGPDRLGSVLYARCVPGDDRGSAGRTQVFRVRAEGDSLLDEYEWFAPGGLVLGWSPITGKVALLAVMQGERADDWKAQEALRFVMGGERLASYTNGELIEMGADETADTVYGRRARFRIIGCEQLPGTNDYDFVIEVGDGKTLRFARGARAVHLGRTPSDALLHSVTPSFQMAISR